METIKNPARRGLFRGKVHQPPSLRLPWVIDETSFINGCDQCQDCLSVCETNIIVRDKAGFPKIDFNQGDKECTFCNKCSDVCQKPLFKKDKKQDPWPAKISISDKCFAKNSIYCQSCRDICEPRAINFIQTSHSIPIPEITINDCNSCGACLTACPQNAIAFLDERENKYA